MNAIAVQQHAVDRYMERTGSKGQMRCCEKLWIKAQFAVHIPIGNNRFYDTRNGWIVVIFKGIVKTIYRPKTLEQFASIHKAMVKAKGQAAADKKNFMLNIMMMNGAFLCMTISFCLRC